MSNKFTVIGYTPFPSDMLRYDSCYPADSESADEMFASYHDEEDHRTEPYKVHLIGNGPL